MRCNLPGLWGLGITPNRFSAMPGTSLGGNGPATLFACNSSARYLSMMSGCSATDERQVVRAGGNDLARRVADAQAPFQPEE